MVKHLLDPDRYDTNVLPTDDSDEPVPVRIGLLLNQIIDLVCRSVIISSLGEIGSNVIYSFLFYFNIFIFILFMFLLYPGRKEPSIDDKSLGEFGE